VDDLAAAEAVGLVSVEGEAVRFRHPLVRAAISQTAALSVRQAAHRALAETYAADPDRSVWHRAATLTGPDEQVAADLEAAAERALRRGAPAGAAAALERAHGSAIPHQVVAACWYALPRSSSSSGARISLAGTSWRRSR
jgi:hypothetical protein